MTNLKEFSAFPLAFGLCLGLGLSVVAGLGGCAEEEEPVVVAPPPPPPPPPAPPAATTIEELMAAHNIDPRIQLPEDRAPLKTEDRVAVLKFFDAMVRSNDGAMRSMLAMPDQFALDHLVRTGQFATNASSIKAVRIQTGEGRYDKVCALAEIDLSTPTTLDLQAQLWSYTSNGDSYQFEAEPSPPGMIDRLSGSNWIRSWFEALDLENEIALRPDEILVVKKRVIENIGGGGSGGSPAGPDPSPNDRPQEPLPDPTRMPG